MNVTREVILDLLPVYLAGEASPDTRKLVDDFVKQDAELGREIRQKMVENLAVIAPPSMPPDLEIKALRRTRGLLTRQRWLFGLALFFTLMAFGVNFTIQSGQPVHVQVLAQDYPYQSAASFLTGIALWAAYYSNRRRLRTVG